MTQEKLSFRLLEKEGRLIAKGLARDFGRQGRRPDLFSIARQLGVSRLELRELPTSQRGMLVERPAGGFTIFLNKIDSIRGQRFSLAHELAHIISQPMVPRSLFSAIQHRGKLNPDQNPQYQQFESVCNAIAAELLLPEESFLQRAAGGGWTASWIREISDEALASVEATAWRYLGLVPEPCVLITWEPNGNVWIPTGRPSVNGAAKGVRVRLGGARRQVGKGLTMAFAGDAVIVGKDTVGVARHRGEGAATTVLSEWLGNGRGAYRKVFEFLYLDRGAD